MVRQIVCRKPIWPPLGRGRLQDQLQLSVPTGTAVKELPPIAGGPSQQGKPDKLAPGRGACCPDQFNDVLGPGLSVIDDNEDVPAGT